MINNLHIAGYRLLRDFEADLGRLTVVIGANATGKSTLLDVIQLISHSAEVSLSQAVAWHGGLFSILSAGTPSGEVGWKLTFTKPEYPAFWALAKLPKECEFVYEVSITGDRYGQPVPTYEVLRRADPHPGYAEPFKYLEATPRSSRIFDPRQRKFVPFDTGVSDSSSEDGQPSTCAGSCETNVSPVGTPGVPAKEVSLRLAQMRFFNEYPEPSLMRLLLARCAFYPGFDVSPSSAIRTQPAEIKPETLLSLRGENLGVVLHEILTRHDFRDSAEDLRTFLRTAYPSFEEINAETAYGAAGKVLVRLRERNMQRPMELWDLSDGMLRFLCLAAALLNPAPPPFLAVDEPEAGLHPRLLPIVADMIKTASDNTQVLVTTHSPDLLNCFGLDEIAVMTRDESRAIWHRPGSRQSLRKMLESVGGDTLGDLHRSGELEAMG